jgi:hypothetical protein
METFIYILKKTPQHITIIIIIIIIIIMFL